MSAFKLADTIEVSVEEAQKLIDKFFSKVPKVKSFLDMLGRLGKQRGFIRTAKPYNRYRFFDGFEDREDIKRQASIERQSKNTPIQGCNADLTKLALVYCYRYIRDNDFWNPITGKEDIKLIHTVHDEIQSECKDELTEFWEDKMNELMLKAGKVIVKSIPMKVDCSTSEYWTK